MPIYFLLILLNTTVVTRYKEIVTDLEVRKAAPWAAFLYL